MAYITRRKHPVASPAPVAFGKAGPAAASLLTAGLTLTQALPLHAQAQSNTLSEVEVKSSAASDYKADRVSSPKFTQPLVNTTQTISVISEQVMQEQGATTLTEALRNVPGVGTFYAGENGSTSTGDAIYMRGFDTSSSIYVDGVRDLGSIARDVFNIDQIDVVKGPAGTDYGRSAPTGSINLSTKQPKLEDGFSASAGVGSGSYKRGTVDWNKALTGYDGAAFRLNALVQDASVAGRDGIENNRWGIAPSLAFGLNSPTRTYLNFLHVKQDNVPDGGVFTIGLPGYSSPDAAAYAERRGFLDTAAAVDPKNFYGTSSDHDNVTADMATLRIEHDFTPETTLRNTTRWGQTKQDYLLSGIMGQGYSAAGVLGTNGLQTPNPADPSTWSIARIISTRDQVNKIITNQTNVTTSLVSGAVKHDISAGLELTREEQTSYTLATTGTIPRVGVYNPDSSVSLPAYARTGARNDGSTDTYSVYAFDTLKFGPHDQWQVNAGLRYDRYKTDYDTFDATGASTLGLSKSGGLWNYKAGALYKPAPNGSVYVNYALSQQPPGGSNFTLSTAANNAGNPNMDPQKAKTLEFGTKWEVFNKKLLLTGAIFRTDIENEIVSNPDGTVEQTGKKRVDGIEIGAIGQIAPAWAVTAGYTVQDTKVIKGANVAANGSADLAYTPKDAFLLWSTYRLPMGLTVGGGARYAGGLKRGTDGAVGTPNHTDSYWVFDAMATYRLMKNLDIQLNFYNLFDKDYVSAINKSGYRYFPGIPRSARLTANFRF
ncbi:catecholate siderophore receptor Fiu [Ramlibacter sp. H39-3-26]|uniref:catecholate siderophore receptor Fiu n=1 Tax=Curvibacter soli TaxID=3031331 RepID=UPI0023DA0452|nr:catecholate siderophore receptor Fiu [Ramlibacter sp. H39-3-26]MDF1485136.1 catecholate siderophore receptor Fiu [Ramlibacter sp. H39-3-26]